MAHHLEEAIAPGTMKFNNTTLCKIGMSEKGDHIGNTSSCSHIIRSIKTVGEQKGSISCGRCLEDWICLWMCDPIEYFGFTSDLVLVTVDKLFITCTTYMYCCLSCIMFDYQRMSPLHNKSDLILNSVLPSAEFIRPQKAEKAEKAEKKSRKISKMLNR